MKKVLSFLLSLVMVITMLPVGAFAVELETAPVAETQAVTEPADQETEAAETQAAETEPTECPEETASEETAAPTEETVPATTEETVSETEEVQVEETEEAASEQTMSFEAFRTAISEGTFRLQAKVIIEENLTINNRLEVKEHGEIIVPDGVTLTLNGFMLLYDCKLTVEAGGKLVNNGWLTTYNGAVLTVNGTYYEYEGSSLNVKNGHSSVTGVKPYLITLWDEMSTEEELRELFALKGYKGYDAYLSAPLRLSSDLVIKENQSLIVFQYEELTIPAGVKLTVNGFMSVSGMTVEPGGALYVSHGGSISMETGYFHAEGGTVETEYGGIHLNLMEVEVIGADTSRWQAECQAYTYEDLLMAIDACSRYGDVTIYLNKGITLETDMVIPENAVLFMGNPGEQMQMIIPTGMTLTSYGPIIILDGFQLWIQEGATLESHESIMNAVVGVNLLIDGTYIDYSDHGGGGIDRVTTFEELKAAVEAGVAPIFVGNSIRVTEDLTVNTRLDILGDGEIIVPSGVTLTFGTRQEVWNIGKLIVEAGGTLVNKAGIMVECGGVLDVRGNFIMDEPGYVSLIWSYDKSEVISGIDHSLIHAQGNVYNEAELRAMLAETDYRSLIVTIHGTSYYLTSDIHLSDGVRLFVEEEAVLTFAEGNRLILESGSSLINGGRIVVTAPSQIIVEAGAVLKNFGQLEADEGCILYRGSTIVIDADATVVSGKGKLGLSAAIVPEASARITWALAEGDEAYATLKATGNKATLTAADVTGKKTVTVIASAKLENGAEVSDSIEITIVPLVKQITLHSGGVDVTGQTIPYDLAEENVSLTMELAAVVAPRGAQAALMWTSSNEAVATVNNGRVSFTAVPGKVTITAASTDGSKVSAKVTIDARYLIRQLALQEGASELVGGKGTQLKVQDTAAPGVALAASQVVWTLANEADAAYVTVTPAGKVTTKAVPEKINVKLLCRVADNPKAQTLEHTITVYPAVTQVDLYDGDEIYTGRTIRLTKGGVIILQAAQYPVDSMAGVTWDLSDEDGKFVEVLSRTAQSMILKSTGVKGNVTVKITAADGSRKSASVKLQTGNFVTGVVVSSPSIELYSGKSVQLNLEVKPADADNAAVVWSLGDPSDKQYVSVSASGLVTAKKGLSMSKPVTIVATAKDGSGVCGSFTFQLRPADPGTLVIMTNEYTNVTGTTLDVNLLTGGTVRLKAKYFNTDSAEVAWSGKNVTFSEADAAGYVTATVSGKGTFTVTADDGNGKKATVKLKAANLSERIVISGPTAVASGKSIQLAATILPEGKVADKKVTWWVDPVHTQYATISASGKLTAAKNLTSARNISVWAQAKDGNSRPKMYCVDILPLAQSVRILERGIDVTNTTYTWDLSVDEGKPAITAEVFAADACQDVIWKLSGAKVLQQNADGTFSVTGKTGTATVTATAADGSGKKASFKFTVVKSMEYLEQSRTEAVLAGGKSLKLASFLTVDKTATNQKLNWSMTGDTEVATLNASGVLKTKKVTAVHTITVTATAADGSGCQAEFTVYVYPATTSVKLLCDGAAAPMRASLGIGETMTLEGISLPSAAAQGPGAYNWSLSSDALADLNENADGTVTLTGKAAGTVTVTCTAADGSGKKATLKIKIG